MSTEKKKPRNENGQSKKLRSQRWIVAIRRSCSTGHVLVPYLAGSARAPRSIPRRPKVLAIAAAKMSSSFAEGDESVSTYLRQLMNCLNVQLALY
jgi:hypothetical protein